MSDGAPKDGSIKLMKGERIILEEGYFGKKCRHQIIQKWINLYGAITKKLSVQITIYEGPHSRAREDRWEKILNEKFRYNELSKAAKDINKV